MTKKPSDSRVLVTGASGFIGSNLVKRLVDKGYSVRTFGRSSSPGKLLRDVPIEHQSGDVTNLEDVEEAVVGVDVIYHLAGLISYEAKDANRQAGVNVQGTKNVMEAALRHGTKRVIHTSSIAAMGIPKNGQVGDETLEYNLSGKGFNYCDSKYAAELEVRQCWQKGLPVLILSPGITLGEGDSHSHHHAIIRALSKKSVIYVPAGGVTFSDIKDVVEAHVNAIEKGRTGERYCLVSENLTFKQAAEKFARVTEVNPRIVVVPGKVLVGLSMLSESFLPALRKAVPLSRQQAWLAQHNIFFSSDKAKEELDFDPTPFTETIKRTSRFYLDPEKN